METTSTPYSIAGRSLRSATALTKEQRDLLPELLAAIGPSSVPTLIDYLADPHEHVRAVCAAALGRLKAPEALGRFAELTADPSDFVRANVAGAVGLLEPHSLVDVGTMMRARDLDRARP